MISDAASVITKLDPDTTWVSLTTAGLVLLAVVRMIVQGNNVRRDVKDLRDDLKSMSANTWTKQDQALWAERLARRADKIKLRIPSTDLRHNTNIGQELEGEEHDGGD